MEYKKQKEAYSKISELCKKYLDISKQDHCYSDIEEMAKKADNHLELIEWYEKYGLDIPHDRSIVGYNYFKIDDFQMFSYYSDAKQEKENGSGRYISWEDNDKQPLNEWLFKLGFSTGAYIFGKDYPTDLFQDFWHELKSYKPDYCDSTNHNMYFKLDNAKKIYNDFPEILEKYREINKEDSKKRKIEKMRKELEKLEANK